MKVERYDVHGKMSWRISEKGNLSLDVSVTPSGEFMISRGSQVVFIGRAVMELGEHFATTGQLPDVIDTD